MNIQGLSGWWIILQPTYDNGDNTDSWCDTFTVVPKKYMPDPALIYGNCAQTTPNRLYGSKDGFLKKGIFDQPISAFYCQL